MPISVRCPKCGHGYQLRDELAGKQAKCRCGEVLDIPVATTLTSLLDEEHIGDPAEALGEAVPPGTFPSRPQSHFGEAAERKKSGKDNKIAIAAVVAGGAAVLFVVFLAAFLFNGSQHHRPAAVDTRSTQRVLLARPGQATPREAFESFKRAWISGDWPRVYALLTPEAQRQMTAALAVISASLGAACPELSAVATEHGVEPEMFLSLVGPDPFAAAEPEQSAANSLVSHISNAAALIRDEQTFFSAAMPLFVKFLQSAEFASIEKMGSSELSGISLSDAICLLPIVGPSSALADVRIDGDEASGVVTEGRIRSEPRAPNEEPGFTGNGLHHQVTTFANTNKIPEPKSQTDEAPADGEAKTTPLEFERRAGSWYIGLAS